MKAINRGGEEFYKMDNVYEFIESCNIRKKSIISIEFFEMSNGCVIPFEDLSSIDSTGLFDETNDESTNAELCNNFVKDCIDKCFDKLETMYFCAVLA